MVHACNPSSSETDTEGTAVQRWSFFSSRLLLLLKSLLSNNESLIFIYLFIKMHLFFSVCVCLGACGGQKMALDSLELNLQAVVRCLRLILGPRFRSSARTVYALNCISALPSFPLCMAIVIILFACDTLGALF